MARNSENIADAITNVKTIISEQSESLSTVKDTLISKGATEVASIPDESKTPLESNSDTIAEILDMTNNLPEAGTTDGYVGGIGYGKKWVRPSNFPNYDYVDRTNEEAIYYTYDCSAARANPDFVKPPIAALNVASRRCKLEIGYININGFHAESELSYFSADSIFVELPITRDFCVVRITPLEDSRITACGITNFNDIIYTEQPLVEIYGRLPNLTQLGFGYASANFSSRFTESIDLICPAEITLPKSFYQNENLKNISISTPSNLKPTMLSYQDQVFYRCKNLTKIDISDWDTSNISTVGSMFRECCNLLEVSLFSITNKLTTLANLFSGCYQLRKINCLSWDTSNVTNMQYLFNSCYFLEDVSFIYDWDVSKVTTVVYAFYQCKSLEKLDLSKWKLGTAITTLDNTFNGCSKLKYLDISSFDMSTPKNLNNAFRNLPSLTDFYPCALYVTVMLNESSLLSDDSIARIIDALQTVETKQTLTLHADVKSKLTDEQIAGATEKGWTIA